MPEKDRYDQFAAAVEKLPLSDTLRDVVSQVITMMSEVRADLEAMQGRFGGAVISDGYAVQANNALLDELRRPMGDANPFALLQWCQMAVEKIADYLAHGRSSTPPEQTRYFDMQDAYLQELRSAINDELDRQALSRTEQTLLRAERAADAAEKAQENAERASGASGEASLSSYFKKYADSEEVRATGFRWTSVGLVTLAMMGAGFVLFLPALQVDPNDWTGLTTKFAILAGAGSLAAYFARQSAVHRRASTWARTLEIQLNSFPAFVDGVPEEGRTATYLALGQRVLGAPPNKDGDVTTDQGLPAAQIIDLVTAALKKN